MWARTISQWQERERELLAANVRLREELRAADSRIATLQIRVEHWVSTRMGLEHMDSGERAMRLLEESLELTQAEGITREMAVRQAHHVYDRRPGKPVQEAAGVAVCLLGWCASARVNLASIALQEIERIEAKPLEQIRGSLARKTDADLVTAVQRDSRSCGPDWARSMGTGEAR